MDMRYGNVVKERFCFSFYVRGFYQMAVFVLPRRLGMVELQSTEGNTRGKSLRRRQRLFLFGRLCIDITVSLVDVVLSLIVFNSLFLYEGSSQVSLTCVCVSRIPYMEFVTIRSQYLENQF